MNRRHFVGIGSLAVAARVGNGQQSNAFSRLRGAFRVDKVPFVTALNRLAVSTKPELLFGLELYTSPIKTTEKLLSVALEDASVETIVQELCRQQGGYTPVYDGKTQVVNILPVNAPQDYTGLQTLPVKSQRIQGESWPENLLQQFTNSCAEIYEYKEAKFREYLRNHPGMIPAGTPGSIMTGTIAPPPYSIHLSGMRLRDQLNELAAYTRSMPPVKSPSSFNGEIPLHSYGWTFTILPDAEAHNGLGGYPVWKPFPTWLL